MYHLFIRLQAYFNRITLEWVCISIVIGAVVAGVFWSKKKDFIWKTVVLYMLIMYILLVIGSTIVCRPLMLDRQINVHIVSTYRHRFQYNIDTRFEVLLNCMMLVPLGFLLPIAIPKLKAINVILIGAIASMLIEVGQYVTMRGILEVVDIIDNTIGTVLGYAFYQGIRFLIQRLKLKTKK